MSDLKNAPIHMLAFHRGDRMGMPARVRDVTTEKAMAGGPATAQVLAFAESHAGFRAAFGLPPCAVMSESYWEAGGPSRYRISPDQLSGPVSNDTMRDPVPVAHLPTVAVNPRVTWIDAGIALLRAMWCRLRREREIARSIETLCGMDDRALRDIGLHRSDIIRVVRYGADYSYMMESDKRGVQL